MTAVSKLILSVVLTSVPLLITAMIYLKQQQSKKKLKPTIFKPIFKSADQVSSSMSQISIKQEKLPFSLWHKFHDKLSNKLHYQKTLSKLEKSVQLMIASKASNEFKSMWKHRHNIHRMKENAQFKQSRLNLQTIQDIQSEKSLKHFFKTDFDLDGELSHLKLKHISSLWSHLDNLTRKRETNCMICQYNINESLSITMECCGIELHFDCLTSYINSKQNMYGSRINLNSLGCFICKKKIEIQSYDSLLKQLNGLYNRLLKKYENRLKYDEKNDKNIEFANKKYIYYICFKCGDPYWAGMNVCHEQNNNEIKPEKRLCSKCNKVKGYPNNCKIHDKTFIQWKCKFCCSVATWECRGDTHFCELCHSNASRLWDLDKSEILQCPCISDRKTCMPRKVDIDTCPLNINHPPHGEEYCLGCAECHRLSVLTMEE